jgi:hypothetical protein
MRKLAFIGAAAVVLSTVAAPAMAQQVIYNPGYCAQYYPNANCQNLGPGNPYTDNNYRRPAAAWRGDAYAYDQGSRRTGFVCHPGSRFRGADGRIHICR